MSGKRKRDESSDAVTKRITLNVGGTKFLTTRATVCNYPECVLNSMLRDDGVGSQSDEDGSFFVVRSISCCRCLMAFLSIVHFTGP